MGEADVCEATVDGGPGSGGEGPIPMALTARGRLEVLPKNRDQDRRFLLRVLRMAEAWEDARLAAKTALTTRGRAKRRNGADLLKLTQDCERCEEALLALLASKPRAQR